MYAAYPPAPMPMYVPRVQRNLQTLGMLWCVLGVYRVVTGLIGMFFLRAFTTHRFDDSLDVRGPLARSDDDAGLV